MRTFFHLFSGSETDKTEVTEKDSSQNNVDSVTTVTTTAEVSNCTTITTQADITPVSSSADTPGKTVCINTVNRNFQISAIGNS